ncbi:hypothetical protein BJY04DRAFT_230882 [Aspergillus karnatakaensis]|uniref:FAD-binding oxidoreductase n=1 Tax=Aspergillus karnatakaensis TaxID=1810916 RepID=UPI003CCCD5BB
MSMTAEQAFLNLRDAGLEEVLYLPNTQKYDDRIASHWSATPRLRPWGIVQPRNTEEVARAVRAVVAAKDVKFAVRSGGHMVWAGASEIVDGITIDLGLMDNTSYNAETEIASLQPGGTWVAAYEELEKHQVINYEVVLADGRIVNANTNENADLFIALKGGGNNFGIVTRFDMLTFPAKDIWDLTIQAPKESSVRAAQVLVDGTKNLNNAPDDHLIAVWWHFPKATEHIVFVDVLNLDGESGTETHKMLDAIPGQRTGYTAPVAERLRKFVDFSGKQDTWYNLVFKADIRIVLKAVEVFEALIETFKGPIPDSNFSFQMVFQPLPASFRARSLERGGNVLGLDHIQEDCIQLVWVIEVETAELNDTVTAPLLKKAVGEIDAFARSIGGGSDFLYLNYCDVTQNPLGSYGEENVRKIRDAAAKYDPEGVFQTRVPGGFKISKVGKGGN